MKPTLIVTTALLLAVFADVACSKRDEASPEKVSTAGSATGAAVGTAGEAPAPKRTSDEAVNAAAAPTPQPATFADGKAAYQVGKYSDATVIFERYVSRRPANASGHYMLGLSAWKSGDLGKAESAFDKALAIDPRHVKSLLNLSRVLIDLKRYEDAAGKLTQAAEIDPSSTEVHRLLGRTYHAQGKTDEAMHAYRHAIELNGLDAWSMNNLGLLLLEQQRAEEAVPLLARAVELRKEMPVFHNNLGMALEHTGRFSDAAAAYSGALSADPGYDKAKQNLARVEAVTQGREQ